MAPSALPLDCLSPLHLADFCALVVPSIWSGAFAQHHPWIASAKRHASFKLFCHKLLKATQVSSACVLLALYYIHRLRSAYPSIQASIGSEVRLLTTALILANKFLDDNTFTNKTWSDVSGIPVRELNIMEVEFLSALNYSIYIHHRDFFAWAARCQQHYNAHHQPPRSVKASTSMPAICSPAVKRPAAAAPASQPRAAKRRQQQQQHAAPCTPPDETITHQPVIIHSNAPSSYPRTPLYTPLVPSDMPLYATAPAACGPASSAVCQPVLSWSSSSSALASSRHSALLLGARARCLEIE